MAELFVVSSLEGAEGCLACAAALACALAAIDRERSGVVLVEAHRERSRGPTLLASDSARRLEVELRAQGFDAAARGRVAWVVADSGSEFAEAVAAARGAAEPAGAGFVVVAAPSEHLRATLAAAGGPATAVIRADLPRQLPLAALLVRELRDEGLAVRLATRQPGRVAARRALAGVDPGGAAARRSLRLARLAAETGQALPLVLGSLVALIACALVLTAFGGAVSGASRAQRATDLAALSGARSMRNDFDRLFAPARFADGTLNPAHLEKREYLTRAAAAAREAADRNGVALERLRIEFPDSESLAPLRVRAELASELEAPGPVANPAVETYAEAEAVPPSTGVATDDGPAFASGGGYSGPLVYRQGEGMRPDVAAAFDRMAAAAAGDGITLLVNSGFRSDAEQAILFAANPDPRMVAPPGTSLHRCATELDLGPPTAYPWLAANAGRFGFLQRYSWVLADLAKASIHSIGGADSSTSGSCSARSLPTISIRRFGTM